jgi:hypothetical protein
VFKALRRRYGSAFTINLPIIKKTVVISDPNLVKDLFGTSPDLVGVPDTNLGSMLGPGSSFGLTASNTSGAANFWSRRFMASG